MIHETECIQQALQGNAQAFTYLVEQYQRPVFNLCYRMLGDWQDAEDAAQETFLRAFQHLRRYDQKRPFVTWLLSIAAHHCIDQTRKRRFRLVSTDEAPESDLVQPPPSVEALVSQNEEHQRLQALLCQLEPFDRAAVVLYYWYDLPYEEICRTLGLTTSALKSRLHRARRALAEAWGKGEGTTSKNPRHENPAPSILPPPGEPLLVERIA